MNMLKKICVAFQYVLPQHLLSQSIGWLADSHLPWLKNAFIRIFITMYHVNLREAIVEDPSAYPTFNDFFTRHLKPELRPIAPSPQAIATPADGTLSQCGRIQQDQLLQAKQFYFDLPTLLGNDVTDAQTFLNGYFATIYLAPHNYHRVHMPITGKLIKTVYVPGKLFSVNRMTSELIPQLYSRNERLICYFQTEVGTMAVILVGAMIVGSIQTVWMDDPVRATHVQTEPAPYDFILNKGAELGLFKMGSTVIVLFPQDTIQWSPTLQSSQLVHMGEELGHFS